MAIIGRINICICEHQQLLHWHWDTVASENQFTSDPFSNAVQTNDYVMKNWLFQGGIDFSGCQEDPETGLCCVEKEETVTSLEKEPILECTHKNVEQCHYTYVTQFTPSQEEVNLE